MSSSHLPESLTLEVYREMLVQASPADTFESILEEMGPASTMPGGEPMPMVLEARPGGRWYRDLGNNAGHLWGHVQVIKPPRLLELCGPMFMSCPVLSHVQYRILETEGGCRMSMTHRLLGEVPQEFRSTLGAGWDHHLKRIVDHATR